MFKYTVMGLLAVALMSCSTGRKMDASMASDDSNLEIYRAPAASCMRDGFKECKNARRNDLVAQYALKSNGDFFRIMENGTPCQITNGVDSFKISQHPNDAAMVYFERNNDLYVLHNVGANGNNCPKADKKVIMGSVKKYTVTSNTESSIVNVALDTSGRLAAWDNNKVVYEDSMVVDYSMNQCFGASGKSFSSVVFFSIDPHGNVSKIRPSKDAWGVFGKVSDAPDRASSITDWKENNRVCN
ncbi:MAG: hypothetical protein M9962_15120 [Oligoflexia bacterium]|nr:hypothetical protein [Oligoflexia bacterium]